MKRDISLLVLCCHLFLAEENILYDTGIVRQSRVQSLVGLYNNEARAKKNFGLAIVTSLEM